MYINLCLGSRLNPPLIYSSMPSAETGSAAAKSAGGIFISSPFILISVSGRPVFLCFPFNSQISGASDSFSSSSISASLNIKLQKLSVGAIAFRLRSITSKYHEGGCNHRHLLRHFQEGHQMSTFSNWILIHLLGSFLPGLQLPPY